MKKSKFLSKITAVFLALMLCMTMAIPALAVSLPTTTSTITVDGLEDGVAMNVDAYKIIDVNLNADNTAPKSPAYTWANDSLATWITANYPTYIDTTNGTNDVTEAFNTVLSTDVEADLTSQDNTAAKFYDDLANAIKQGTVVLAVADTQAKAEAGTTVSFADMALGNYLVLIEDGVKVYRPSAVNITPTWNADTSTWDIESPATVTIKSSDVSVDKEVKEDGDTDYKNAANTSIGDTVNYQITALVPQYPVDAVAKTFVISDTLSAGLTLDDASIKVYGVTTDGTETEITTTLFTVAAVDDQNFTATLNAGSYDTGLKQYASVIVRYNAVLNENADVTTTGNNNEVTLTYNNNPYETPTHEVTDTDTKVYSYNIDITKVDKADGTTVLAGATFTITDDSKANATISFVQVAVGNYRVATAEEIAAGTGIVTSVVSDANGKILLAGLDAGTYTATETKAPDGFNLLKDPVSITITDELGDIPNGSVETAAVEDGDAIASVTIENSSSFELPITGGMGTIIFTAGGVLLIGAAVVLLVVANKRKANGNA